MLYLLDKPLLSTLNFAMPDPPGDDESSSGEEPQPRDGEGG